jgi:predicted nucleic acid-binding protein
VLSEFFVAVTRKIAQPLSLSDARRRINVYLQTSTVFALTGIIVLDAVLAVETYQFSFWDAQIWAVARLNQIALVFSEDFNVGASIEGVQFINPFAPTFRLRDWIA